MVEQEASATKGTPVKQREARPLEDKARRSRCDLAD